MHSKETVFLPKEERTDKPSSLFFLYCAANIGILGLEKKGIESYQITIGGDEGDSYALGELLGPGLPGEAVPDAIEAIVALYLARRETGESFIETYRRIGLGPFKAAFKEFSDALA